VHHPTGVERLRSEPHVATMTASFPEFLSETRGPRRSYTRTDAGGAVIESWDLDAGVTYPTHLPHLPGEAGPSDAGRRRVDASVERGGGTGAARCVRSERDVADCVERSGRSQPAARVLLA
jgi:hypothetical protein